MWVWNNGSMSGANHADLWVTVTLKSEQWMHQWALFCGDVLHKFHPSLWSTWDQSSQKNSLPWNSLKSSLQLAALSQTSCRAEIGNITSCCQYKWEPCNSGVTCLNGTQIHAVPLQPTPEDNRWENTSLISFSTPATKYIDTDINKQQITKLKLLIEVWKSNRDEW